MKSRERENLKVVPTKRRSSLINFNSKLTLKHLLAASLPVIPYRK